MVALIISLVVLLFGFVIALSYARLKSQRRQQALEKKKRQAMPVVENSFSQHFNEQMAKPDSDDFSSSADSSLATEPVVVLSDKAVSVSKTLSSSNADEERVLDVQSRRRAEQPSTQTTMDVKHEVMDSFQAENVDFSTRISNSVSTRQEWDELISLTILAPEGLFFTGETIKRVLVAVDMRLGEMGIYHRSLPDGRINLFSVANLVSPGTLKEEQLNDMEIPGLVVFMRLPCAINNLVAFDAMLETADIIARHLNGRVCDKHRQAITETTLETMRNRILTFNLVQHADYQSHKHDYSL